MMMMMMMVESVLNAAGGLVSCCTHKYDRGGLTLVVWAWWSDKAAVWRTAVRWRSIASTVHASSIRWSVSTEPSSEISARRLRSGLWRHQSITFRQSTLSDSTGVRSAVGRSLLVVGPSGTHWRMFSVTGRVVLDERWRQQFLLGSNRDAITGHWRSHGGH